MNPELQTLNFITQELYGLYEMDETGFISYCRIRKDNALIDSKPKLIGQIFFSAVLTEENVSGFRFRVNEFRNSLEPSRLFIFDYKFEKKNLPIEVLFVRIRKFDDLTTSQLIIVDIRKFNY